MSAYSPSYITLTTYCTIVGYNCDGFRKRKILRCSKDPIRFCILPRAGAGASSGLPEAASPLAVAEERALSQEAADDEGRHHEADGHKDGEEDGSADGDGLARDCRRVKLDATELYSALRNIRYSIKPLGRISG